jgi:hypothetical protein
MALKKTIGVPVAVLVFILAMAAVSYSWDCRSLPEEDARIAAARVAAMDLAVSLKGQLMRTINEDGAVAAIPFCHERAPHITQSLSESRGWRVDRTALRVRNPDNRPDDWERDVLEKFSQRIENGGAVAEQEFWQICESLEGKRQFRYMKAIPTGEVCLVCHGSDIDPEVAENLDRLYPQDQARGFELGELRGAVTITRELEDGDGNPTESVSEERK